MNDQLQAKLATLPMSSGCYLMKDKNGTIIYVGKAKKLKNRVNQYFRGAHDYKTTKLVSNIVDFDYVVTNSEKEALLLEINLIKKYRPRFNIIFMDDKSYPYIRLTNEEYPTLQVVRDLKKQKDARYFGPYPDVQAARKTLELLQELFPLRRCKHMPNKVCLYYHMGMCLGPCEFEIEPGVYKKMREDIIRFLKGDIKEIEKELIIKRDTASENLEFEQAKKYHELLLSLSHVVAKQQVDFDHTKDIDAFGYYCDKGYIAIQGLFIRNGKLLDRAFRLEPMYDDALEMFTSFMMQYYLEHPAPNLLLLPQEVDMELIQESVPFKVHQPVKGAYKKFLDMTVANAKQQLEQKFVVESEHLLKEEKAMSQLYELLQQDVSRIELYDNSHISGAFAVGGCVVFIDGLPQKHLYRHYKVHNENDDFANMKEVIYRRYSRMIEEEDVFADLIIVDGGVLQIHAAKEVLSTLGVDVRVLGLVKDDKHRTHALIDEYEQYFPIEASSELFFLLTRMQDEVHGYTIRFHQKLREKQQTKSILDEVSGIGEKRKKKLMNHFGSFKKIKEATIEQLSEILPQQVASDLYRVLHEQ
ncbi:MAG: excinuclease ABC subunit UvrC [Erysipelotrichaceae bacterium]|nr:excinuclease ABC subunit UvrC [Erysipelotrichaceae bacterium]